MAAPVIDPKRNGRRSLADGTSEDSLEAALRFGSITIKPRPLWNGMDPVPKISRILRQ
jgi:hypothetical protein